TVLTSTPPRVIVPESASQKRAASFDAVDFPLPDGPTSAVTSPCFATNDTPFKTGSSLYENTTFLNSISYPLLLQTLVPVCSGVASICFIRLTLTSAENTSAISIKQLVKGS